MGLHAFNKEFDAAVAAMPPLPKLGIMTERGEDPLVRMESRASAFRVEVRTWRSQAENWIPELRSVFERALSDGDAAALQSLIDEQMPELRATYEALASQIEEAASDLEERFDESRERAPATRREALDAVGAAVALALAESRDAVNFVRDSLRTIEWEFDPDARGGPVFDDPEDLIASLG